MHQSNTSLANVDNMDNISYNENSHRHKFRVMAKPNEPSILDITLNLYLTTRCQLNCITLNYQLSI